MKLCSYVKFNHEEVCRSLLLVLSHINPVKSQVSFTFLMTIICHWTMCEPYNLLHRNGNRKGRALYNYNFITFFFFFLKERERDRGKAKSFYIDLFSYFYWETIQQQLLLLQVYLLLIISLILTCLFRRRVFWSVCYMSVCVRITIYYTVFLPLDQIRVKFSNSRGICS